MAEHECHQTKRIDLLEKDLRDLRNVTNGKFDRMQTTIEAGQDKIWRKLDEMSKKDTELAVADAIASGDVKENKASVRYISKIAFFAITAILQIVLLLKVVGVL